MIYKREVEAVLNEADIQEPTGLRDRAIMEVLYSTGIRRGEVLNLRMDDLLVERGIIMVQQGKGKKDRFVPIGERAIAWTMKYLSDVRVTLECQMSDRRLFLTEYGEPMLAKHLSGRITRYIKKGIGRQGSCHLFRHTMASLMLENGADIRQIQKMLGHASIESTEIYTHVSIKQLKEVHDRTHPGK